MTPVMQTETGRKRGNCMQAAIASLFDLELMQVPHFMLYGDNWFQVFCGWLYSVGWEFNGFVEFNPEARSRVLKKYPSVNGFYYASVPSRTYPGEDVSHAVIINRLGLVVHDPNPNQLWYGVNAIKTGELQGWDILQPRTDEYVQWIL